MATIEMKCEVTQTTSLGSTISSPKIIISSNFRDGQYVRVSFDDKEFYASGHDLIMAIRACMNIND